MSLDLLFTQLLNGLVLGALLLLVSLGLSLIFGLGRVVNFAHGTLYALGALLTISLTTWLGSFWAALLVAPLAVGLGGVVIDRVVIRPIRHRPELDTLLLTFGLTLFLTGGMRKIWGAVPRVLSPPEILSGTLFLFGQGFPAYRLFAAAFAIFVACILFVLLSRTLWGLRVRAANDDPEMAAVYGVNRHVVMSSVFGVGCLLAGVAGVVAVPAFSAYPTMGESIIIQAFLVIVLGGLGSLRGSVAGAFLVGLVITIGGGYIGEYSVIVLFVVVILVLSFRPTGLFGEGRVG